MTLVSKQEGNKICALQCGASLLLATHVSNMFQYLCIAAHSVPDVHCKSAQHVSTDLYVHVSKALPSVLTGSCRLTWAVPVRREHWTKSWEAQSSRRQVFSKNWAFCRQRRTSKQSHMPHAFICLSTYIASDAMPEILSSHLLSSTTELKLETRWSKGTQNLMSYRGLGELLGSSIWSSTVESIFSSVYRMKHNVWAIRTQPNLTASVRLFASSKSTIQIQVKLSWASLHGRRNAVLLSSNLASHCFFWVINFNCRELQYKATVKVHQ